MIRVTVEILPGGNETRARHLGTALIANDLADSLVSGGDLGSYDFAFSKRGKPIRSIATAAKTHVWKRGRVEGFDRVKRGPWDLLYLALREAVGKRNP